MLEKNSSSKTIFSLNLGTEFFQNDTSIYALQNAEKLVAVSFLDGPFWKIKVSRFFLASYNLGEFTDHQLLCSCYDLFAAGLDTTASTCRSFILYMINYPEIQAKVHAELDAVIGRENVRRDKLNCGKSSWLIPIYFPASRKAFVQRFL